MSKPLPVWVRICTAGVGIVVFVTVVAALRSITGPAGGPPYTLEVRSGDTAASVAQTLEQNHIVKNAQLLYFMLIQNGTAQRLQQGLYPFTGQLTLYEVVVRLSQPALPLTIKVTVPEGRRLKDLPLIFKKAGFTFSMDSALHDVHVSPYAKNSLEGFLFPATYQFYLTETPAEVVQAMVARMQEECTPERIAQAKSLGLDVYDWVTLASMVQAEAASDVDMPIIAGVFLNRLQAQIPLGSDPTVAYGLGKDLPQLDRSAGDFLRDTPYNTYTRKGLPHGPINNPGHAALMSVLSPVRKLADGRTALYFLHGHHGEIYVNHDYSEHLRDVSRYR